MKWIEVIMQLDNIICIEYQEQVVKSTTITSDVNAIKKIKRYLSFLEIYPVSISITVDVTHP